ncbi:sulfhydryl oxidase 2-like isoform X2 [Dioscorea cayenensis subsp. rotundata]|uniref:Sulfhydryl oxidase 2-like isoform X2 n=1 Tax=Dioscorea cayennensis subsp. rotundata TaxID=55577 RepID=A0AB40AME0_DIOCR|nr:sulfhydryl oxidase 2-like isoform X2 [Dioscorea cayenensis subsp. rotundata]
MLANKFHRLLVFVLLVLPVLEASVISLGPRHLGGHGIYPLEASVELNITNFDAVLTDSPTTYAIVEFFAHWCPACRNYKPHYEKVARLFNGPEAVHPGIVLMAHVDCALKMNSDLCDQFSVRHYPMLLWGPPTKFVSGKWDSKQEKNEIQPIDDGRTAERLLNWINNKIGSSTVVTTS